MVQPSTNRPDDPTDGETASHARPASRPPDPEGGETRDYTGAESVTGEADTAVVDLPRELAAVFGDRYELGEHLGKGGFGSVYRAHDRRLHRDVAMKVSRAHSSDPDKLLREARSLAQMRHAGIVAVYDVAVTPGYCFVVSELLRGPSLHAWLDGKRPTPVEAVQIVAAVADALAHAHARSIVHRDVKPSNIVFAEDGRPVVVDFGLAMSDLDVAAERGVVSGTPAYMSPEQAGGRGHRPDGRTDIYGLAATLYAVLCGRPPFRGRNGPDVLRQVREDEPQPIRQIRPDVPPELDRVCLKAMAKNPGDRYTTAADFADALRRSVGLLPPLSPPPAAPPPVAPTVRLTPTPAVVPAPSRRGPRTERRQVTLLQCAFEAQAGEDDDPTEQVAAFQAACAEAVAAHGGVTLNATGTAFLACFGYPVAREDAPRQAVRAGLAVVRRTNPPAAVAVGTGSAVITDQPPAAPVVVGDVATATAALLSQGTGGVVVADVTFRLIEGYFDCEPAGEVQLRGAAPVKVFAVRAEREAHNRVEAADPARLTPLVGRDREVALLKERWELTAEGVQNVILLVADPGLGKSRLVRVLREFALYSHDGGSPGESSRSATGFAAVVEWYCSPYHAGSPFYPLIDYFDRSYHLSREPDPDVRLDRLLTRLAAGRRAQSAFANDEAIAHLRRGLEVLAGLPESPDRDGRELQFQASLAVALMTARGYAHPDLESVHARARRLCERIGPSAPLFHVIWGNWVLRLIRDEQTVAIRLAAEMTALAGASGDRGLMVEAAFAVAITTLYRGEFAERRAACDRCRGLEDLAAAVAHSVHTGQNSGVVYRCYAALADWYLGFPDRAAAGMREAVEFARGTGHPFSLAYALHHADWLAYLLRDGGAALRHADECMEVSEKQGFAFWKSLALVGRGTAHMVAGRTGPALANVTEGLALYHATGSKKSLSEYHGFLAEIHLRAGRPAEARNEVATGLDFTKDTYNRVYEAELHRLAGEVGLAESEPAAAEAAFHRCLEVARRQGALSWELRGATSVARLWRNVGRAAEARELLAAVYGRFTEGFATPDSPDARALLAELEQAVPT